MWEKFQASSPDPCNVDEIREMRLQLLNTQLNEMTQKNHELEASFDLLSDMLVQCIKHLQSDDAKTIVSQILTTVSKVNEAGGAPSSSSCSEVRSEKKAVQPQPQQQQQQSPQNNIVLPHPDDPSPAKSRPPPLQAAALAVKPKIPQLSLDHVEPSAWLRGEPTAGDVYHT